MNWRAAVFAQPEQSALVQTLEWCTYILCCNPSTILALIIWTVKIIIITVIWRIRVVWVWRQFQAQRWITLSQAGKESNIDFVFSYGDVPIQSHIDLCLCGTQSLWYTWKLRIARGKVNSMLSLPTMPQSIFPWVAVPSSFYIPPHQWLSTRFS